LNLGTWRSVDGGKSFSRIRVPHGDCHILWIDPKDPHRMIEGNDGGATVSFDGGSTWSTVYNQPTAEFYQVPTDDQFPYRIHGARRALSVPMNVPDRVLAARPEHALRHGAKSVQDHGRRRHLAGDQPGPDGPRSRHARPGGRTDHA